MVVPWFARLRPGGSHPLPFFASLLFHFRLSFPKNKRPTRFPFGQLPLNRVRGLPH